MSHGTGISTYIYHKFQHIHVGKYTVRPMEYGNPTLPPYRFAAFLGVLFVVFRGARWSQELDLDLATP